MDSVPPNAWNCHVHCFDPERYPYNQDRAYTPHPAKLDELITYSPAGRIMIVQASIEDGFRGLLANLKRCQLEYPRHVVRGTVYADPNPSRGLQLMTQDEFDGMHRAGVRSIRIHGSYGGPGDDGDWVCSQLTSVAGSYPVKSLGWSISCQLPLATWAAVKNFITEGEILANVTIVADHDGSAIPSDIGTQEFEDFLFILRTGRLNVKIGALLRRSPQGIHHMQTVVEQLAKNAPEGIVWGSDWPYINASKNGAERLEPGEPLKFDTIEELKVLRKWLTDEQWVNMLVKNPERLFGS
ncbi:hypothetical protein BGZ60DRAFT_392336 [Tricladium varicosporioides]|nr:hypothetical protein BGZ60DRAFT_392336 [Hymenoscyphus varicosporioides]